jgi:hypothetical protein
MGRETTRELPVSEAIAGVNIRPLLGAIHELHWYKGTE